jgi:hypothetical protein
VLGANIGMGGTGEKTNRTSICGHFNKGTMKTIIAFFLYMFSQIILSSYEWYIFILNGFYLLQNTLSLLGALDLRDDVPTELLASFLAFTNY